MACEDSTQEAVITNETIELKDQEDSIETNETIDETSIEAEDEIVEADENAVVMEDKMIDYEKIRPNEAGRVMVIMYHSLGEQENNYVSTPDILRQNLQDLYERDYVLVSLEDLVNNTMDIPAGKTPVVLTFDDGHKSNFNVIETSEGITIDPDSAVGIIDGFYEKHPGFNRKATFFLNANISFSQPEYKTFKLEYLVEKGYDLGSHSYGHEDLGALDAEGIQKTLGRNVQSIEAILDGYTVNTLALPFGKRPKDPNLEKYVFKGVYEEKPYEFIAVLNVGWNPTYAPIHQDFNYKSINRVQSGSGDFQLTYWIDYFDQNPDRKYISDGMNDQITVPKALEDQINKEKINNQTLMIYEREEE